MDLPRIKHRKQFAHLINHLGYKTAVEVGIFEGNFSILLLENTALEKLYCVDSWLQKYMRPRVDAKKIQATSLNRLQAHKDRVEILNMDSLEAAKQIEDESIDFIYIDADHRYEPVKADLNAWWPKVKTGGCLAGHDYKNIYPKKRVKEAVDEFFGGENNVNHTLLDGCRSWWVIK